MRGKVSIAGVDYDNVSLDGEVGFLEDTHKYVLLKDKKFKFNSVTTLLKEYESEEFIPIDKATSCNASRNSKYYGMGVDNILAQWDHARNIGTELHDYGEKLLNGEENPIVPDDPRAVFVPVLIEELKNHGYELAVTELLVHSEDLALAGQSDIVLKKQYQTARENVTQYMIYDFKFLGKEIDKKSYYNRRTHKYKKMLGMFRHLHDCNWIHYSIQLSIYQTLTGDPAKVTEKVLVVVTKDGYKFVPCYPMRVFWDANKEMQAVYQVWNGKWYDSRTDRLHTNKPDDIVGL